MYDSCIINTPGHVRQESVGATACMFLPFSHIILATRYFHQTPVLSHPAMLSMLHFQLFALHFLISGSISGSDPGLRAGDTPSQIPDDGKDGLGNLVSLEQSPNSDSNQQSLGLPATLQTGQCQPGKNKTPSGKRSRRRQLPQYCPQPLTPAGEGHNQQHQNNNEDLNTNTGPSRGRTSKRPDPNLNPDVFIMPPESEEKWPEEICPPIHPPIDGTIPLTIPLCALDEHARPDTHMGFAGMYALEYCNPCMLFLFSTKRLFVSCIDSSESLPVYLIFMTGNQFYGCAPFEALWCCTKKIIEVYIPQRHRTSLS